MTREQQYRRQIERKFERIKKIDANIIQLKQLQDELLTQVGNLLTKIKEWKKEHAK